MTDGDRPTRRTAARRRRTIRTAIVGTLVGCLAAGGAAFAAHRDPGERYRTAVAATAAVEQTIEAVGTVASAGRADAAFSVAGTVATVAVGVGDVVAAGDVLATLDPTTLQDTLDRAEADLADAEQQLQDDLDSQTASTTTASATTPTATPTVTPTADPTGPSGSGSGGGASPDPAVAAAIEAVRRAQAALLAQDDVAAAALATSRASLAASQTACEAFLALGATDPTPPAGDPTSDPTAPAEDPTGDPTAPADPTSDPTAPADDPLTDPAATQALADCQDALGVVRADQDAVDAAQALLMDRAAELDAAVGEAQRALQAAASTTGGSTPATTTPTTTAPTTTGTSTGTPTSAADSSAALGGGSSGTTSVASAEDLLSDRAAIALAEATVDVARAERASATVTSPIAGTVGAVGFAVGDAVGASSTTAVVSVLGDAGHMVTMTLGLSVIDLVAVGQTAAVTVASSDAVLAGTVANVGVLDVSDSSTPEYTVVVSLDPTDSAGTALFDGASAHVTIAVAGNDQTLTVPTSAVHVTTDGTTVTVLRGGSPVDVEVQVGAMGAELTEVRSGLAAGDEVVLADLRAPLDDTGSEGDGGLTGLSGGGTSVTVPSGGQLPAPPLG